MPPDAGNGPENAGLPLARLLWHLPAAPLVALVEALLLERRILMVAQERDTVSAAVHAAGALLYPLRWQHIFLPLLPLALRVRPRARSTRHACMHACRAAHAAATAALQPTGCTPAGIKAVQQGS